MMMRLASKIEVSVETSGYMTAVHYQTGCFPPDERLDWSRLIPLIGPVAASVARYEGMLAAVPNSGVLLAPLTTRGEVLSSKIEGTQATMAEELEFEAGRGPESVTRRDDIQEVLNYRAAMRRAEVMLQKLPLSGRGIREAHSILLSGVRGEGKSPGAYRVLPNWIGPPGSTKETATFVPISADKLLDAMSAWERYIHGEASDTLVKLAILHAEFEALHPFLDGNGRLGRLFIPLFLWQAGLIRAPRFYISEYLESNRKEYYERLLAVSRDDDWTGWCLFFLRAIMVQAEENLRKTQGILDLYEQVKGQIVDLTRSRYAIAALDTIFEHPIFTTTDFVSWTGSADRTARRILDSLRERGILRVLVRGSGNRASVIAFSALLNIAEGREVF